MTSVVLSLLYSLRFIVRSPVSLHPAARSTLHIVKPETIVAWHHRGFRMFWTWKSRHCIGRPVVPYEIRALIREMSTTNPPWGAPRIHGELQKLGISVSQSTVANYMRRHLRPPSQTWRTFLTNHASQIVAADLFVVPTITFRLLSVLVLLGHDRRRIVHVAVTEHPTAAWAAQQLPLSFTPSSVTQRTLKHAWPGAFLTFHILSIRARVFETSVIGVRTDFSIGTTDPATALPSFVRSHAGSLPIEPSRY